jgi:hypothetical protein
MNKQTNDTTKIKVTVQIPDKVPNHVKREKINRLYEILKPQKPC